MKAFNFTASRLSKFFYTKGVNDNEKFVKVWSRYLLPFMDQSTGIISTRIGDPNDGSLLSLTNPQTPSPTSGPTTPLSRLVITIQCVMWKVN